MDRAKSFEKHTYFMIILLLVFLGKIGLALNGSEASPHVAASGERISVQAMGVPLGDLLEVIEKKFSSERTKGSDIAYLLCCLRDAGLTAYHPFVNLCTDELIQKQQEDGSWESEYGEDYYTNATIEALRVLKHYKVI